MPDVQEPLCLIQFWRIPLSSLPLSGVIRNWTPQYKDQEGGITLEQNQLNRLHMVQFDCPMYRSPCVSFISGRFPFPLFPSRGNKNWTPQYKDQEGRGRKFFGTNSAQQDANGPV